MSRSVVRCRELDHLPSEISVEVEDGMLLDVLLLRGGGPGDGPSSNRSALRRLILRRPEELATAPPEGRDRILRLQVVGSSDLRFVVVERHDALPVEVQADGDAFRLNRDDEVLPGQTLSVRPRGRQEVQFTFAAEQAVGRGLNAGVGGADWSRDPGQDVVVYAGWVTPDVAATLDAPKAALAARVKAAGAALGAWRTTALLVLPYAVFLVSGAVLYELATADQRAAEAKASALQDELDAANQALTASSSTTESCEEDRVSLATRLSDATKLNEAKAAVVLNLSDTQQRVGQEGGPWVSQPALLSLDARLASATTNAVALVMLGLTDPPTAAEVQPCLAQKAALAVGAPTYVLTWSPSEDWVCREGMSGAIGGVPREGRWGLSARVARDFGPTGTTASEEPLQSDPWAARALVNGVTSLRGAILSADTSGRPPVAPSQADLWALAMLDAYSQLPSLASGVLDETGEACVGRLMAQVAEAATNPALGEPVLPDLVTVANGAPLVGVEPDPGCPWPTGAFQGAAKRALLAAARLALVEEEP